LLDKSEFMESKIIANLFLLLIFSCASIGNLLAWGLNKQKWVIFTKPFLMPVLAIYYVLNCDDASIILVIALLFAFLGDVFLIWPEKKIFFTLGLGGFLIMQALYIYFIVTRQLDFVNYSLLQLSSAIVFLLAGMLIYFMLFNYLKEMKIPVLVYMLVILAVAFFSFLNMSGNFSKNNLIQFLGAISFVISDTVLAYDSFKKPIRLANVWIMATYIIAQLFLFVGFINT